jgi:hypothetical protein
MPESAARPVNRMAASAGVFRDWDMVLAPYVKVDADKQVV